MACCGKQAVIRVERVNYTPAISRPKIVRTVKHNLSAKVTTPASAIKPANDRDKYRV